MSPLVPPLAPIRPDNKGTGAVNVAPLIFSGKQWSLWSHVGQFKAERDGS